MGDTFTHSLSTRQFREKKMGLISDPWDDEDLEVDRLESRLRQVRTVQHRSYSQWNDSTTTNRPVLQPVEVKPTVRIMKRDTTAESTKKNNDTEVVQQSLADKERAYAEARQRILGIPPPATTSSSSPTNEPKTHRGGGGSGQSGSGRSGRNKPRGRNGRGGAGQQHNNAQYNNSDERGQQNSAPMRGQRARGRVNGYRGCGRGRVEHQNT